MPLYRKTTLTEISEPWYWNERESYLDPADARLNVKLYKHFQPCDPPDRRCEHCTHAMIWHGWIRTLEGGHIVCPFDRIATGAKGEHYPIKPAVFEANYELVPDRA